MTLTPAQRAAARLYSGSYHLKVNGYLRGEEEPDDEVRAVIASLDSAIADSPLAHDMELYRGVSGTVASYMRASGLRLGSILSDDAFMSTSTDPSAAGIFSLFPPGGLILKIIAPAGTLALDIAPFSEFPEEREVLLPRGTRLRVLGYDAAARTVETEIVG